jgi:hypothetical protein
MYPGYLLVFCWNFFAFISIKILVSGFYVISLALGWGSVAFLFLKNLWRTDVNFELVLIQMFGKIHQWSNLVLGFPWWEVFKSIHHLYFLNIYLGFLLLVCFSGLCFSKDLFHLLYWHTMIKFSSIIFFLFCKFDNLLSYLIPNFWNFNLLFLNINLAKWLSILWTFSENHLLVLLIFVYCFTACVIYHQSNFYYNPLYSNFGFNLIFFLQLLKIET